MTAGRPDAAVPLFGDIVEVLGPWRPVYQRWWEQPGRNADVVMPWSAVDQARLDRLLAADPHSLAASAEQLGGVSVWLAHVGASVRELGALAGIGLARNRCVELAGTIADWADEAGSLARDLRAVGALLEHLVAVVMAHLGRAEQVLAVGGWDEPVHGDQVLDGAIGPVPDELVDRHARELAPLRAVLARAETAGCPASAGTQACPAGHEVSRDWCAERGEQGSGAWLSEPSPSGSAPEVTTGDADQIWQVWRPLSSAGDDTAPDRAADPERAVASGNGPVMPGTEGRRPGTGLGVRIAELPDARTRRSGR